MSGPASSPLTTQTFDLRESSDSRGVYSYLLVIDASSSYRRALPAVRDGRTAERDELVRRLEVTGDRGAASLWDRPAHLAIETSPPGAAVALERFALQGERWVAVLETSLGPTPVADHPVAPAGE